MAKYIYYVTGVDSQFIDNMEESYCHSKERALQIAKGYESRGLKAEIERQLSCIYKENSCWELIYKTK